MKKNKTLFLIIIILMTVIGLFSTDIYLPSLPRISLDFNSNQSNVQLTISVFLLGLSVPQLIYGPLCERFGRKPIVLLGVVIFVISSLLCLLSTSLVMLIISRLFQGIGACAGMTVGRSMIGDVFSKKESTKIFATVFPFVGLSPAIAPVIGGYVNSYFGWRAVFSILLISGLVLLYLIIVHLPETMNKNKKSSMHLYNIIKNYGLLLKDKTFIGYAIIPCIAYIAYFAYLSDSPFILHNNGYDARFIGMCYISLSISYVVGNFTSRKLLNYFDINNVLNIGYIIFFISGILMVLMNIGEFSIIRFLIPITLLTFANGFLIPLGSAGVITNFQNLSGYASGLLGFLQLGCASLSAGLIGQIAQGSSINLAFYLLITTILGISLFYILVFFRRKLIAEGSVT